MKTLTIGLDWDGTISAYPSAFGFLADLFDKCVVITLNETITINIAASKLGLDKAKIALEICPNENIGHYDKWKADMCFAHDVDIMFDDDTDVVSACVKKGIKAVAVAELRFMYRKT